MKTPRYALIAAMLMLSQASNSFGQATPPATPPADPPAGKPETPPGQDRKHTVNEKSSENAQAVQGVLKQFDTKRDEFAAARKALLERLKAATTEEEKKAILEEMRTQKRDQAEERRAMGKEIRDELKKLREERKSGGD